MTASYVPPLFDIQVFMPTNVDAERYKDARPVGEYLHAKFDWEWNIPAAGVFKIKGSHPLAPTIKQSRFKVVPVRTWQNGEEWAGRVMNVEAERVGPYGEEILTVYCMSNLYWLLTVLAWVNTFFPAEVQIGLTGKQDMMFGSVDWVLKYFFGKNAIRQGIPVYMQLPLRAEPFNFPTIDQLLDLNELLTWVDGIDFVMLSARFTRLDELFRKTVETGEIGMTMDLVIPAEYAAQGRTMPQVFNTSGLQALQDIIDITSDNFLNLDSLNDPANQGLVNFTMPEPGYVFHTHKKRDRRFQIWSSDWGNVVGYKRYIAHATGSKAIVGGQAPELLNSIVEFAANLAVQAIAGAITAVFGLPGVGALAVGDMFDDIFFAFQEFNDYALRDMLGRDGFVEGFGDNTAAWTFDAFAVGLNTLKRMSGDDTIELTLETGGIPGKDLQFGSDTEIIDGVEVHFDRRYKVGDEVTLHDSGTYIETWISKVSVEDARDGRKREHVTLGNRARSGDAFGKVFDKLSDLFAHTRALAVSSS